MLPKPLPAIAAALLLMLVSGAAGALGLGGMRTQSALNQPFYAEIELTGVRPDEIDAVRARLASRADFSKAGTERPHFLTRLRFNAAIGTDGRPYIQVSSSEPIREPYIDFLVEVLWPQGRLVKEYTVLLDPPARGRSAPPRVVPPSTSTVAPRRPPPEPEPAPAMRRSSPEPERQAPPPPAPAPAPVPAEARGTRFPIYYGPVPRGATLTRIARELTPPGATAEQTAMALFRNNQDAFMRGNINMLRVGVDLVVPTAEELFALDQAAARRQFEDALAGRSVNTSPITDVTGDAQLRIAGGADPVAGAAQPGAAPAPALRDDLLMVQETTESNRQETAELRGRISELEQQLADIQRLLSLRNEQLAQLRQTAGTGAPGAGAQPLPRPAPPASAALPEPFALPPEAAAYAAAPDGGDRAPAEPIVEPGIGIVGPDGVVQELLPPPATEPAAAPAGSVAGDVSQARADGTAVTTTEAAGAAEDSSAAAVAPPAEEADQPVWSAALEGAGDAARAVPAWALGVVAGTLGLGALGLVAYRRRRQLATASGADAAPDTAATEASAVAAGVAAADFDEQPSTADQLELDTLPDLSSDLLVDSGGARADSEPAIDAETGLPLNVVSNIPQSQLETQEADVIAEADIYILYGRYREAEALLREELERLPDRPDLKYKLGEALVGSGNREALAALLEDMRAAGDDARDAAKWASLQSGLAGLGDAPDADGTPAAPPRIRPTEINSTATGSDPALSADPAGSTELPEDEDTDLGFSVREVSPSSADRLREQMADLELDLQELDAFGGSLESTQAGDGSASPRGYSEDLPGVESTDPPVDPGAPPSPAGSVPATGGGRLDLDLDALEELTATPADSAPADLTLPVPDELPTIGLGDRAAADATRAGGAAGAARDETLAALPDPLDPAPSLAVADPAGPDGLAEEAPAGAPVEDSISSDVLSSQWRMDSGLWDEAGTKMDLARAYIEMDDPDAARAILDEVVLEGSESQRAEASALLAKLG